MGNSPEIIVVRELPYGVQVNPEKEKKGGQQEVKGGLIAGIIGIVIALAAVNTEADAVIWNISFANGEFKNELNVGETRLSRIRLVNQKKTIPVFEIRKTIKEGLHVKLWRILSDREEGFPYDVTEGIKGRIPNFIIAPCSNVTAPLYDQNLKPARLTPLATCAIPAKYVEGQDQRPKKPLRNKDNEFVVRQYNPAFRD